MNDWKGERNERKGKIEHLEGTAFSQIIFVSQQAIETERGGEKQLSLYTRSFITKSWGAQGKEGMEWGYISAPT